MEEIFHANGQSAAIGAVDSLGRRTGLWRFTHPDGAKQGHATFVEGLRHGDFIELYPGGNPKENSVFREGQRHGPVRLFYRDGQPLFVGTLLPLPLVDITGWTGAGETGRGDGLCALYFPNGVRRCLLPWSNGVLVNGRHTFRLENDDVDPVLTGRWRDSHRVTWLGRRVAGVPSVTYYDFAQFWPLDDPGRPPVAKAPAQLDVQFSPPPVVSDAFPSIEISPPPVEDGMRDYF